MCLGQRGSPVHYQFYDFAQMHGEKISKCHCLKNGENVVSERYKVLNVHIYHS